MSRHTQTTRHAGLSVLFLAIASTLFASCATAVAALSATGQPSLSLTAPLSTLACTTSGTCVTLGASGGATGATVAGEIRNTKGAWSALRLPAAPGATFYGAACAATTCLFGGSRGGRDLLWAVNANNGVLHALSGPAGGVVVRDLSCASATTCTSIDQAAHGLTRLSRTTNDGRTWSPARTLGWARNTTTVLDCPATLVCFVATSSPAHVVALRETLDGGAVWHVVATPATWTSLSSLSCATTCTVLVNSASGSAIATPTTATTATPTTTPAATSAGVAAWKPTLLTFSATSMACTTAATCVVVGHDAAQSPTMAQWQAGTVRTVALTYVPTPLTNVACEPAVCVAIGVTTVVALRP
jgi:hypothetical protein